MAKKKAAKAPQAPKKTGYELAMERLGDAVEALDEAQALLAGETEAAEFWIGILFSAQTSMALVAEMAHEFEKETSKAGKKAARKKR